MVDNNKTYLGVPPANLRGATGPVGCMLTPHSPKHAPSKPLNVSAELAYPVLPQIPGNHVILLPPQHGKAMNAASLLAQEFQPRNDLFLFPLATLHAERGQ